MVDVEKTFNVCQMSGNYSKNKSEIKIHLTKNRVFFLGVHVCFDISDLCQKKTNYQFI